MPKIEIETIINAGRQLVFDLSRSIDLHKISTKQTSEEAVAGKISGLIGIDECVTWKARHFGMYHHLTSKITCFESPHNFTDEMQEGAFKWFRHQHIFTTYNNITLMHDIFEYESPFGLLGKCADTLFLKRYMTKLLEKRNEIIKEFAESDKWRMVIPSF